MKTLSFIFTVVFWSVAFHSVHAQNLETKPLLTQYISLKDAFVQSNVASITREAKKLHLLTESSIFKDEASQDLIQTIQAGLLGIANTHELRQQVNHFKSVSENFITLLKKTGVPEKEVYVQYCPMASNNTGATWLSVDRNIKNPYFGDKMLTCGFIQETLH